MATSKQTKHKEMYIKIDTYTYMFTYTCSQKLNIQVLIELKYKYYKMCQLQYVKIHFI